MVVAELSAPARRRPGGQPGNRNAVKCGRHTAEMRAMRRRIHAWRCRNKTVLAEARFELAVRKGARAIAALGVEELERLRVQFRIACGNDLTALGATAALPVGDDAARAFDDGNERGDIPAVKGRLDDEIGEAERERAEDVAVAAPARHLDGALHAPERLALFLEEISVGMGGAEDRVREIGTDAHLERQNRAAKVKLCGTVDADEAFADPRLIDDAEHGSLIRLKRDERAPFV